MAKTIEVEVDVDGTIAIKGVGFSGPECKKATRPLEGALGITTEVKLLADYYKPSAEPIKVAR